MSLMAGLIQGDARAIPVSDESVKCVVTSPPYWGLRDYGLPQFVWGGDAGCEHKWAESERKWGGGAQGQTGQRADRIFTAHGVPVTVGTCLRCSAWRGCLGLEPTPELYVQHLVEVFREIRRVLRKDGTVWLNLGDSYTSGGRKTRDPGQSKIHPALENWSAGRAENPPGLKDKDLVGIPWRAAFALQEDGWWLRSDIIWAKPNAMPESVTDRPTRAHEYIFLLAKSERYYYNAEAIRENNQGSAPWGARAPDGKAEQEHSQGRHGASSIFKGMSREEKMKWYENGRNRRSVWTIATKPYPDAHFATFPTDLVKPCVLAGSRPRDLVLDPFCGSGTVCFVAKELGRRTVGVDLNPIYLKMAEKRLRQEVLAL